MAVDKNVLRICYPQKNGWDRSYLKTLYVSSAAVTQRTGLRKDEKTVS